MDTLNKLTLSLSCVGEEHCFQDLPHTFLSGPFRLCQACPPLSEIFTSQEQFSFGFLFSFPFLLSPPSFIPSPPLLSSPFPSPLLFFPCTGCQAQGILGKCFTTELYPQPLENILNTTFSTTIFS